MVKTRKQIAEQKEPTLSENRQAAIQKRWAEERSKKEATESLVSLKLHFSPKN